MPLGATYWNNDAEDSRLDPDFTGVTVTVTGENDLWDRVALKDVVTIYQRDYHYGMSHPLEMGYFYVLNTDTDEQTVAGDTSCLTAPDIYPAPGSGHDIKQLKTGQTTSWRFPFHVETSDDYDLDFYMRAQPNGDIGDTFALYHFQPYAYYDWPAGAIAGIIMHLGLDDDYIDTDSFSDSYDEQVTAAALGYVGYAREVGVSVWESLKEISTHADHMFGLDMEGRVTVPMRTTPTATTTALAGVKSLTWRYTSEHLYNDVRITGGMASLATQTPRHNEPTEMSGNNEVANDDYHFRAEWDATMAGTRGEDWTETDTWSTSSRIYETLRIAGTELQTDGPLVERTLPTHYRLFSYIGAGLDLKVATMDKYKYPLREATAVQDYHGLDYDVGHKVTNVSLGGDTVADMRCIWKEIDDDNHTVTSVLLEEV